MGHYRGTWQPTGHYPYDLGPCQSNKRIQVAEAELSLNPLGHLLESCHIEGVSTGWLLGEKKKHHAQNGQDAILNFQNRAI